MGRTRKYFWILAISLSVVFLGPPLLFTGFIALGGAPLLARTFWIQPFSISSGTMYPTLWVDDYIFTSNSAYGFRSPYFAGSDGRARLEVKPQQGDVVAFINPNNPASAIVSRIIGMPDDRVRLTEGRLYLNDVLVPRMAAAPFLEPGEYGEQIPAYTEMLPNGLLHNILEASDDRMGDNMDEITVPQESYFMMGDNRDNSNDSRFDLGFVPEDYIIGKASLVLFNRQALMRHQWIE
ncbi:signal peptidase I [Pararhizobium capsulatum DSM 1112]|uniref:Signal peptidase I n=1 Tax=Pararhizobium capsulatum DSM 1112 TaxID=1121113 RepID=A0ABU0BSS6_9HYPH|nr:signal peptidase I [Pararhizobium capsulatum]MDQ0321017.1 signal peptidase I [Pararhizobium capsulatum DSM 1112]